MRTTIYFVRHGEVYNPKGILYYRLPYFKLSENGRNEIRQTALFLDKKDISHIFSSPMLRARQTAEIINSTIKLPRITINSKLIEIRTSLQGKFFRDLSPNQSEIYDPKYRQPSDETIKDIADRLISFTKYIDKIHNGQRVVAVSHGDPLMALIAAIGKQPMTFASIRPGFYIQHGEVLEVVIENDKEITAEIIFSPVTK